MPAAFVTNFGTTVKASHIKQIINAWQGVASAGVPFNLSTVNSDSTYAAKIRNQGAGGALLVQSSAGATLLNVTDSGVSGISFAAGSVGAPGLTIGGDGTTGWYRPGANEWAWSDQGTKRVHWRSGNLEFLDGLQSNLGTITADEPNLSSTVTWNSGGVAFTALKVVATDTASAAGSLLLDLHGGSSPASKFSVRKDGLTTVANGIVVTAGGVTVTAGGVTITAGGLTVSAGGAAITGNSTIAGTLGSLTGVTLASGVLTVPNGSAGTPPITTASDANTGIFFSGSDSVGIATGGTERLSVDANGRATFTGRGLYVPNSYDPTNGEVFSLSLNPSDTVSLTDTQAVFPFGNVSGGQFSGLLVLNDHTTGQIALLLIGGGQGSIIAQTSANEFNFASSAASKTNLYFGGTGSLNLVLENKTGGTKQYSIMALRTRADS